jgi:SanA protein
MRRLFTTLIILAVMLALPWALISWMTKGRIYRDPDTTPERKVWLLLGTTPSVNGIQNMFFSTRIEAAKALYEKKKITHILVSWDNSTVGYNEPQAMKNALMRAWIPEGDITLDHAGLDTLDSVVRAKVIFGQEDGFIIISQPFHVERALFLAYSRNIDAIGFGAANVSFDIGKKTYIREVGARWKAIIDVLLGTEPKILWEKEKLTGED